jgi:flagellar basal body-associated protein FliL
MAEHDVSDSLAKWVFLVTMIATLLYALAVSVFVLGNNDAEGPSPQAGAEP